MATTTPYAAVTSAANVPAATPSTFTVDIGGGIHVSTGEIVGLVVAVSVAIIIFVLAIMILFYYCNCCGRKKNRRSMIVYDDETGTYPQGTYPAWQSSAAMSEVSQVAAAYHEPKSEEKVKPGMFERASSSRSWLFRGSSTESEASRGRKS